MAQQHTAVIARRRPLAAALSGLLAAVAFLLLPTTTAAAETQVQRPGGAVQYTPAKPGVQIGHGKSGTHLSYGQIGSHPETTPPPPFITPGPGDRARHRAHGGPSQGVGPAGRVLGQDVAVPRPRGPPGGRPRPHDPVDA